MGGRRDSAAGQAYRMLKRQLLTCELEPSSELREAEVAERLGLGRTPTREALSRLVHEGLVEVRPRQGYRVAEITLQGVREAFELRRQLEPLSVRLAIERATDEELQSLHVYAHSEYDHSDQDTYERFIEDNREFHVRLAAFGNVRLSRMLRGILEEHQRLYFRGLGMRDVSQEHSQEHHRLYDAVLARDLETAERLCIEQIDSGQESAVAALMAEIGALSWRRPHGESAVRSRAI